MNEYYSHIDFYLNHWTQYHNTLVSPAECGNKTAAKDFLRKYWLPGFEYELHWKKIEDIIFIPRVRFPEMIFQEEYKLIPSRGGCLFLKKDFEMLQNRFTSLGNQHFVVIEDTFDGALREPQFRMKFPANISWGELTSGNYISAMILNASRKHFYVFGETKSWGRYSGSDLEHPMDLTGFLPQHSRLFQEMLKTSTNEEQVISSWLPSVYKSRI